MIMRRPKLTRPTVELFNDGEILDVNDLHRRGAFRSPMWFPFKKLRTYPDRLEIYFRDRNRPPQTVLIERTRLYLGGQRPWFLCYKCHRRCAKLYPVGVDHWCRRCGELQFTSQRQRLKKRLATRAENIRNRLWLDGEKITRPRYMRRATYRKHLNTLSRIQHAINNGRRIASPRYQRWRERDQYGQYCDEQADYETI
jgi:hypothetical protein